MDNRDVGLSRMYGGPEDIDGGYSIDDMADDVISVLDHARVVTSHVVGQSMGGMIAQRVALRYADRVDSLGLIYTTSNIDKYRRSPMSPIVVPERQSRAHAIENAVRRERVSMSPGFTFDEAWAWEVAARSFDRAYAPDGFVRQATAIRATFTGDRTASLSTLQMPIAIFHGRDDPYFHSDSAIAMALACPGSTLHLYAGMGHEIPGALYPEFAGAIADCAQSAVRRKEAQLDANRS
ncbi:hypothetical protein AXA44_08500 [Rhodococcus sp. SC4]|nr:hypothetical protein AXA44_08500 [Rhodococcus sp. SC4]